MRSVIFSEALLIDVSSNIYYSKIGRAVTLVECVKVRIKKCNVSQLGSGMQ